MFDLYNEIRKFNIKNQQLYVNKKHFYAYINNIKIRIGDIRMDENSEVYEALEVAYKTGQQVTIGLRSGATLEGVIVEELWDTSFRVWLEPAEPVKPGKDIDKAIVAIYAVKSVEFGAEA
jgi:hypothetical protein